MKKIGRALTCLFFITNVYTSASQNLIPVENNGIFSFLTHDFKFEVNSHKGGKACSFSLNDKEIIYIDSTEYLWGSTFWPSPQKEWNWPPSDQLDLGKYEGKIVENSIVLTSQKDSVTGFIFKKIIVASDKNKSVTLTYRMINKSGKTKYNAPWEVTRVACGGLTFFPKGDGELWGKLTPYFQEIDGIVYYKYEKSHSGRKKFNSDGKEGWLAHITSDRLLFIKQFDDIPLKNQAPGEAEIELWLTPEHSHIELENQGQYVKIENRDSIDYVVKWYLRKIPQDIKVEIGNNEMINYVYKVLDVQR